MSAIALIALVSGARGSAQGPLQLQIVSPPEGAYVSDRLTLEARILPRERRREVADVTFFADGRQVCRSTDVEAPKCSWDAGALIKPHVIRVVANDRVWRAARRDHHHARSGFQGRRRRSHRPGQRVGRRSQRPVRGRPDAGINFAIAEDGIPQSIVYFADEEAPLEIVVAMDISASMGHALDDLRVAVRHFLAQLRPEDQVTLVAFNDEPFVLTQRETDPSVRAQALDRLSTWGGTTLYDVIIRSLELLSRRPGRRSLIVFSDGEDQSSQATFAHVERALKGSDAALFAVGLGRGREQANLRETLEALAEPSGGRALFADRPAELDKVFAELRTELAHQYLVGYESTNAKPDGSWRKVSVEIPGTNYRVRSRQGYFAPAQ